MSIGVKAAIGAVIPVVCIVVIALSFLFLRRRKKSQTHRDGTEATGVQRRSTQASDLMVVEAKFDRPDKPELHGESVVLAANKRYDERSADGNVDSGVAATAFSYTNPQEMRHPHDWTQRHELGTPSRTASLHSGDQTLASAGEQGERDLYLEKLEAKKAVIAEERDRLRRMEMLKEEDERLEKEIEDHKRSRGF